MADGGGHFADLMVFAFGEFDGDPTIWNGFSDSDGRGAWGEVGLRIEKEGAAGECLVGAEEEAALEAEEAFGGGDAFDLGPVFAEVAVGGMQEFGVEVGFVAEQEEAFAISIEAADGIDALGEAESGEGGPFRAGFRGELGEDAVGFVKGEQHRLECGESGEAGRWGLCEK
jgi:hypothetical protein